MTSLAPVQEMTRASRQVAGQQHRFVRPIVDGEPLHHMVAVPVEPESPAAPQYFSAMDIARALGIGGEAGKKKVKRTAAVEQWPSQLVGNKLVFVPPTAIAALIVATPADVDAQPATPIVRFRDLAHSDSARDKVLLRETAVKLLAENLSLGKEVALQLVVARMQADHPMFPCSVRALREWFDKYRQHGINALVEQKRGRVGVKPFAAQLEETHLLAAAAGSVERGIKGRLNIARGYRDTLVNNPTVTGPSRLWMHGDNASKSYVPPSIRDAIRERVSPLAVRLIQQGPKAAKLDGPYTECSYDNLPAGRAFTADDMTANCYVWCEWPNEDGFILIRPQILAAMDVGSMAWLNVRAVMRPKGQYTKDDVWGLVGDVFDEFGLFEEAIFEGGTWQSSVVTGKQTGLDDETRFGGMKSLGVKLHHTRTPRGKIIETAFNSLQHAADNVRGFCGRMEMKDCPEDTKANLALVRSGKAHARQFFLHITEYSKHLEGVMNALNHERNDGKILRGLCPVDKWAQDKPQLRQMPDDSKWMYRAAYRVVAVTRNGVRITVGSGKYQTHYCYSNPEALEVQRGRRVVAFWNDYDPDTDAVIYTLRNGHPDKFICVASRVSDVPKLGATAEQMAGEAARKKLSAQLVRSQKVSLAPYLQRSFKTVDTQRQVAAVGEQIHAARVEQGRRIQSRKTLGRFTGSADALLDSEFSNTETSRSATLPPIDQTGESPEGPGRDGNKPLMQNRTAAVPSPRANAGGNTFVERDGSVTYQLKPRPRNARRQFAATSRAAAELAIATRDLKTDTADVADTLSASALLD